MESRIQLKESGIQNPSSTDGEGIQYLESGIHGVKSVREMMDLVRCSPFTQFLTMCRAVTSCLWNAVFVHVQIQLVPNGKFSSPRELASYADALLAHHIDCSQSSIFRKIVEIEDCVDCSHVGLFFLKSTFSPPSPDCYKPRRPAPR